MSHIYYVEQECFGWEITDCLFSNITRGLGEEIAFIGRENVKNIQKTNKIC